MRVLLHMTTNPFAHSSVESSQLFQVFTAPISNTRRGYSIALHCRNMTCNVSKNWQRIKSRQLNLLARLDKIPPICNIILVVIYIRPNALNNV